MIIGHELTHGFDNSGNILRIVELSTLFDSFSRKPEDTLATVSTNVTVEDYDFSITSCPAGNKAFWVHTYILKFDTLANQLPPERFLNI